MSVKTVWEERSLSTIWNNLQPAKTYTSLSNMYASLIVVIVVAIIRFTSNKIMNKRARIYAQTKVKIKLPKWIHQFQSKNELTYEVLSKVTANKLWKTYKKKYDLNSVQQKELKSYHKQCLKFKSETHKYEDTISKFIVDGFIYFYGLCLLFCDGEFFWQPELIWSHFPQPTGSHRIFNINIYYMLCIGAYGYECLLSFCDYSHSDFWAMIIHHWITFLLLIFSQLYGVQQFGAIVLLNVSNSDFLLLLSKLFQRLEIQVMQTSCTILFALWWGPERIYLYFRNVVMSCTDIGYVHIRKSLPLLIMSCGLIIIWLLQFYWTFLIYKMVWTRVLKGKHVKDTRSDDEN